MGHSQVYRMLKSGDLRSHTTSIKPKLSHEQKLRRLNFILSQIIPPTINTLPKFSLMYNVVHIDEKWFFMSRETQRFYLYTWEEEEPYRCVQNKNFIGKVMFIAVVARPLVKTNGDIVGWENRHIPFYRDTNGNQKFKQQGSRYTRMESNYKSQKECYQGKVNC